MLSVKTEIFICRSLADQLLLLRRTDMYNKYIECIYKLIELEKLNLDSIKSDLLVNQKILAKIIDNFDNDDLKTVSERLLPVLLNISNLKVE